MGLPPRQYRLGSLREEERGVVVEMEHRRKSGRGVREWFFLPVASRASIKSAESTATANANAIANVNVNPGAAPRETIRLLDDHPLFRKDADGLAGRDADELSGLTFDLSLTERQRREREGVVLPYFDAQKEGGGGGPGEGGRILYDMGVEDDFDDEEDEI